MVPTLRRKSYYISFESPATDFGVFCFFVFMRSKFNLKIDTRLRGKSKLFLRSRCFVLENLREINDTARITAGHKQEDWIRLFGQRQTKRFFLSRLFRFRPSAKGRRRSPYLTESEENTSRRWLTEKY